MKRKKLFMAGIVFLTSVSLMLSSTPVSATVTSFGKWSSRTKTIYVAVNSATTPWSTGAAKWKNNTNFNVSTTLGTSSTYYAYDVTDSAADWDGLTTLTVSNGIISKAILNNNKHYTSASKYTSSILAGVMGHEVGHSLGLSEASVAEKSSIMYPYTFNSDGTRARALSPSPSDISVVNGLYPILPSSSTNSTSEDTSSRLGSKGDGVYVHASWAVYYEDEEALAKAADLVVKGIVSKENGSKFKKGDYRNYSTEANIEIKEVLKGDHAPGQNIVVSQMGGTDGEVTVFTDSTHLKKNQEIVIFLRKVDNRIFIPINEDDGIFVNESGKFINIDSKKELDQNKIK